MKQATQRGLFVEEAAMLCFQTLGALFDEEQPHRRWGDALPREAREDASVLVRGRTTLVQLNGPKHAALLALGFVELQRDGDCMLLRGP